MMHLRRSSFPQNNPFPTWRSYSRHFPHKSAEPKRAKRMQIIPVSFFLSVGFVCLFAICTARTDRHGHPAQSIVCGIHYSMMSHLDPIDLIDPFSLVF